MTANQQDGGASRGAPARLPTVPALRGILLALDERAEDVPTDDMTYERQQSALAATAATSLLARLNNHIAEIDRLTGDERYMLAVSPLSMLTGGDPRSALAFANHLLQWAGFVVAETTRDDPDGKTTPSVAVSQAIAAALAMIEGFDRAHDAPVIELDGVAYHTASGDDLVYALDHLQQAAAAIGQLLGPPEAV